jgi:hypothetical protein
MKFYNCPPEAAALIERAMSEAPRLEFRVRNAKSTDSTPMHTRSTPTTPQDARRIDGIGEISMARFLALFAEKQ